jgi:hypothetical protein
MPPPLPEILDEYARYVSLVAHAALAVTLAGLSLTLLLAAALALLDRARARKAP